MKRIVLTCDVADEDVEEIVEGAKKHLPTWQVRIEALPQREVDATDKKT